MKNLKLIDRYNKFLLIPDSPRVFLMLGAFKAAEWIDQLNDNDFLELEKQLIDYIENGTDKDLINLIFVTKSCDKRDLKLTVKHLIDSGCGKDNSDVAMYSKSLFKPK